MPKYGFKRDHRKYGGPVLSVSIPASCFEDAREDFRARWAQKCEALDYIDDKPENEGVRTTKEIQAEAMTPEALAVKRNTRGILQR